MANKKWWETAEQVQPLHEHEDGIEFIVMEKRYGIYYYAIVVAREGMRFMVCEWAAGHEIVFVTEN